MLTDEAHIANAIHSLCDMIWPLVVQGGDDALDRAAVLAKIKFNMRTIVEMRSAAATGFDNWNGAA